MFFTLSSILINVYLIFFFLLEKYFEAEAVIGDCGPNLPAALFSKKNNEAGL